MQRIIIALVPFAILANAFGQNGWTDFNVDLVDGQNQVVYVDAVNGSAQGTTYIWVAGTPDPGQNQIGGDPTNPGFAVDAFDTPTNALAALTGGQAGWILLRRGHEWSNHTLAINKSGPSGAGWLLIGAYNDWQHPCDDRPIVDRITIVGGSWTFSNVAIVSVHLRGETDSAISVVKDGNGLFIEDVLITEGEKFGMSVEQHHQNPVGIFDVTIRRSVVHNRYHPSGGHSSGLFAFGIRGMLVEECVFWHNGWHPDFDLGECHQFGTKWGCPTAQNHNVYIDCDNEDVTFINNVTADASSTGWKQRPGGWAENNLSLRNPIGTEWGNNEGTCADAKFYASGVSTHNVFIESRDILDQHHAYGFWIQRVGGKGKESLIKNNLIKRNTLGSGGGALHVTGNADDLLARRNVVFNWQNAPGIDIACRDGFFPTSLEIRDNDFQFHAMGGPSIGRNWVRFDEPGIAHSFAKNRYYSTANSNCWFRAEPDESCPINNPPCKSYSEWVSISGETGASDQQVSYSDSSRDMNSYIETLGYCYCERCADCSTVCSGYDPEEIFCDGITAFMLEAIQQRKGYWREEFTAARVNCYMREGFDMHEPCPADIDGDGAVGVDDLLELLAQWGSCPTECNPAVCTADLTRDCNVGVADLLELFAAWGPCQMGCTESAGGEVPQEFWDCWDLHEPGSQEFLNCLEEAGIESLNGGGGGGEEM